ncbi:hypothetical protein 2 [Wenling picorna-like virus 7]|uniref:hypothetical protein 2 n=1 Tax=Wenling picorna-like virus 7 TaxID=1923535 RepID=UPI00090B1A0A|nr:hypothetical protein 2 [Wenling picorna-like virus 7]APG78482.1 hypothetical protein 2 [Wenling picorna-like virus 7]
MYAVDTILRFSMNASPMHQGRLVVFFQPLVYDVSMYNQAKAYMTTLNHVWLDPSKSSVVEMRIPYRHVRPYLRHPGPKETPGIETSMGMVRCMQFNKLQCPSDAVNPVNVSVVVSFENGRWIVPYDVEQGLNQGNTIAKVINISGANNKLDVRDAYSQKADNALALSVDPLGMHTPGLSVPSFGVSLKGISGLSSARGAVFCDRLTLDPSSINPLTPDISGIDIDEMSYSYLIPLFSLVSTVTWATTDKTNHALLTGFLSPAGSAGDKVDVPLLHYLSRMHLFWRGSLRFKIMVVGTTFHKGLLFFGVHYGDHMSAIEGSNTGCYGSYLSLDQGKNEFIVDVPYISSTPARGSGVKDMDNAIGMWSLSVINPLVTTGTVVDKVEINVLISGGDDFQFHYMRGIPSTDMIYGPGADVFITKDQQIDRNAFKPLDDLEDVYDKFANPKVEEGLNQSALKFISESSLGDGMSNAQVQDALVEPSHEGQPKLVETMVIRKDGGATDEQLQKETITSLDKPSVFHSNFGESVRSLAEVSRRSYWIGRMFAGSPDRAIDLLYLSHVLSGQMVAGDNFLDFTPITYFSRLFGASRGSIRFRFQLAAYVNVKGNVESQGPSAMIWFDPTTNPPLSPTSSPFNGDITANVAARVYGKYGRANAQPLAVLNAVQNVVSVEIPYLSPEYMYTNPLFSSPIDAQSLHYDSGSLTAQPRGCLVLQSLSDAARVVVDVFVEFANDFRFGFFRGATLSYASPGVFGSNYSFGVVKKGDSVPNLGSIVGAGLVNFIGPRA